MLFALGAYALWGVLPAFFLTLAPAGPFEIVAWRVLFSLIFCGLLIMITRSWRSFGVLLRSPRILGAIALAAVFIYINWQTFVIAALTNHVVEAALGYFINPIVTILLGVFVLRERLRPIQWVAVGISVTAVVVLTVGYGQLPWIALILASSFGFYGLIKKRVGGDVDAIGGLTLETLWLAPVAIIQLVVVGLTAGLSFASHGPNHALLLAASGIITAVPLLFFASAARRLPLVYLEFFQYLAPFMQLMFGVFILNEPMPIERWVGFGLVWVALVILTTDMLVVGRTARQKSVESP